MVGVHPVNVSGAGQRACMLSVLYRSFSQALHGHRSKRTPCSSGSEGGAETVLSLMSI